ncbi:MAG: DUF5615 family PIN-like protein [Candidatus Eisenbacteria bacterium]
MKFKIDENLPVAAAAALRRHGHDAVPVLDQVAAGTSDHVISDLVRREGRILLTMDLDFADIRAYRPSEFAGIVILRPRRCSAVAVLDLIERLVVVLGTQSPIGQLWIVDDRRVRVREDST